MQYGTRWLIYKFNITKVYFEKNFKNCSTQNFHKFICDEILYPDPSKPLPATFLNRVSVREAVIGQIPRKYPILLGSGSMHFLTRNNGALNIVIMPELYRDAKKSFVRNLTEIGFYRVPFNLLQDFKYKINDPYLNINALYEFQCDKMVVTTFEEDDFVLLKFDLKLELAYRTVSDDVKKIFDSSDTILIKPDKIAVPSELKERLFGQGEKIKKLSKEMQLKSLTLAYENVFLYDLENIITETFVTELNQRFSTYRLISFSGETKTDNKLALISLSSELKFNLKKDIYKKKVGFELGKVHTKTPFSTTHNNVLNFGILCTQKNKTAGEKITMSQEIIETIHVLDLQNFVNYDRLNPIDVSPNSNDIIEKLVKYKKFKYRFLIENLLFSSNLENDIDVIFVICNG